MVSSVDLTQSPPLLTIDGESYTLSQVKSIVDQQQQLRRRLATHAMSSRRTPGSIPRTSFSRRRNPKSSSDYSLGLWVPGCATRALDDSREHPAGPFVSKVFTKTPLGR